MFPAGYTHKNTLPKRSVSSRTISDYSPFGVLLKERTVESAFFRVGFNGEEKIEEISGEGNNYDYGNRFYNPRIGKFFSLDAFNARYPSYSSYSFALNSPIMAKDVAGDSVWIYSSTIDKSYGFGRHMMIRVKTGDRDVMIEMSGPASGQKIGQVKVSDWNNNHITSRSNVMFHQVMEPINEKNPEKFEQDIIKYAEFFERGNTYQDLNKDNDAEVVANPYLPKYDPYQINSNGFAVSLIEYAGGNVERKDVYITFLGPELLPGTKWSQMEPYFKSLREKYGQDEFYINTFGMTSSQYNVQKQIVKEYNDSIKQTPVGNPSSPADKTHVENSKTKMKNPSEKQKKKSGVSRI